MKILFICTGNICRSPAATCVLRKMIADRGLSEQITVDSAGTFGMYKPTSPSKSMLRVAKVHGYKLTNLSKKVSVSDLASSDLIIFMDEYNYIDSAICSRLNTMIIYIALLNT